MSRGGSIFSDCNRQFNSNDKIGKKPCPLIGLFLIDLLPLPADTWACSLLPLPNFTQTLTRIIAYNSGEAVSHPSMLRVLFWPAAMF